MFDSFNMRRGDALSPHIYTLEQLQQLAASNQLLGTDEVCRVGEDRWTLVSAMNLGGQVGMPPAQVATGDGGGRATKRRIFDIQDVVVISTLLVIIIFAAIFVFSGGGGIKGYLNRLDGATSDVREAIESGNVSRYIDSMENVAVIMEDMANNAQALHAEIFSMSPEDKYQYSSLLNQSIYSIYELMDDGYENKRTPIGNEIGRDHRLGYRMDQIVGRIEAADNGVR